MSFMWGHRRRLWREFPNAELRVSPAFPGPVLPGLFLPLTGAPSASDPTCPLHSLAGSPALPGPHPGLCSLCSLQPFHALKLFFRTFEMTLETRAERLFILDSSHTDYWVVFTHLPFIWHLPACPRPSGGLKGSTSRGRDCGSEGSASSTRMAAVLKTLVDI